MTQHQSDLLRFLAETAHELTARATGAALSADLLAEAAELMELRANLMKRHADNENAAQLTLPLEAAA